ncbi:MAG: threonine synthase [Bacillota bacterium]|nr:threonine synthase [Bacillota bacterium]MDW7685274.1 threonine synthase [Bacillota bacterium]
MSKLAYNSTRGGGESVSAAEAILQGIAADGGLYVPACIPALKDSLDTWRGLGYKELALRVLQYFLTDFSREELSRCVEGAYDSKFDTPEIAPLASKAGVHFLELFHGPTLAFKDMALSILPYLLKTAAAKLGQDKEVVILTATSGDTGKAALEGFAGVEGTRIIVFFPEHGVSQVQKRQMVTQTGENTAVIGIEGNFDDAQRGVKEMFTDRSLIEEMDKKGYVFSSANSINVGRLVPQIAYYFHAYLQLAAAGCVKIGDKVNFAVPTGNFGNILAGYYAKKMGLPVGRLICASNENKVLFDFFATGTYDRRRPFQVTMSPSMDILVSSNLERLLYHISEGDVQSVRSMMNALAAAGEYEISPQMRENLADFHGGYATEEETAKAIRDVFAKEGYLMDPHTAVAYAVYQKYREQSGDLAPTVVVSTASPYKFTKDVMQAIDKKYADVDDFALFAETQALSGTEIPAGVRNLTERPVVHSSVCQADEMQAMVKSILGL